MTYPLASIPGLEVTPGQGPPGPPGAATMTLGGAGLTQPAVNATVVVTILPSTASLHVGQFVSVLGGGDYSLTNIGGPTTATLRNRGQYSSAPAGTVVAPGAPIILTGPPSDANWKDVRDFGATLGDIGPAVGLAALAAGADRSGRIYIPPGPSWAWLTAQLLLFPGLGGVGDISIEGAGTVVALGVGPTDLVINAGGVNGGLSLRGLVFLGNTAIGNDCASIVGTTGNVSVVEKCEFWGVQGSTNKTGACIASGAIQQSIRDCFFAGCGFHGVTGGVITIGAEAHLDNVRMIDFSALAGVGYNKSGGVSWVYVIGSPHLLITECAFDEAVQHILWCDAVNPGDIGAIDIRSTSINCGAQSAFTGALFVSGAGADSLSICDCDVGLLNGSIVSDVTNLRVLSFRRMLFSTASQGLGGRIVKMRPGCGYLEFVDCGGTYRLDTRLGAPTSAAESIRGVTTLYPISQPNVQFWAEGDTGGVSLNQSSDLGTGATFAAVTAGHHLDLLINDLTTPFVIPFTGAEVGIAAFIATINAAFGVPVTASNQGGQLQLVVPIAGQLFSSGAVVASTSADVLASLGLSVGAFTQPAVLIEWDDNSGLADATHNLTGTSGTYTRQSASFNSRPTVSFSGTNALASALWSVALPQPFRVRFCSRHLTNAIAYIFDGAAADSCGIRYVAAQNAIEINAGGGYVSIPVNDTTHAHIFEVEFNGAASRVWVDSDTDFVVVSPGTNVLAAMTVGQVGAGGAAAGAELASLSIAGGLAIAQTHAQWDAYAARKFGIALLFPTGAVRQPFRANHAGSPYTLAANHLLVFVDVSAGAVTLDLPTGLVDGTMLTIDNTAGDASVNNITVNRDGADLIQDPNNPPAAPVATITMVIHGASASWVYGALEAQWRLV